LAAGNFRSVLATWARWAPTTIFLFLVLSDLRSAGRGQAQYSFRATLRYANASGNVNRSQVDAARFLRGYRRMAQLAHSCDIQVAV